MRSCATSGSTCAAAGPQEASDALELGRGDAVAFGRLYITNPDLAERIEARAELAPTDAAHIYDPGPEGYIDFPTRSL